MLTYTHSLISIIYPCYFSRDISTLNRPSESNRSKGWFLSLASTCAQIKFYSRGLCPLMRDGGEENSGPQAFKRFDKCLNSAI